MTDIEARFILGLGPSFSADDLKRAYRKAASDNHPDKGGNPERMVLVNEAYQVLAYAPPTPIVVNEAPSEESWSETTEPSRNHVTAPDHPFEKYVVRVSLGLAVPMWISRFWNGQFDDSADFWGWIIFGVPLLYWFTAMFVRFLVGCGIRVYNLGLRLYNRISGYSYR